MNVIWTTEAEADVYAWLDYMESRNPIAGEQITEMVLASAASLSDMPQMGRNGAVYGTRELKVTGTPLRIIYTVRDKAVVILFIPHDRQKWPPALPNTQ